MADNAIASGVIYRAETELKRLVSQAAGISVLADAVAMFGGLTHAIEETQKQRVQLLSQIEPLRKEHEGLSSSIAEARAQCEAATREHARLLELQKQYDGLEPKLQALREEHERLSSSIVETRAEHARVTKIHAEFLADVRKQIG
jgi:seryl-tRNA synthetase